MPEFDIGNLIIWFIVLLFSLSFHESAHAWTSEKFGDDTGRLQGRISLNPVVHMDPIGTVVFPIVNFIYGVPLLGWAKPVQTNPLLWRDKTKANIWVSAAGPLSNLILAVIAFIIVKALIASGVFEIPYGGRHIMFGLFAPVKGQAAWLIPLAKMLNVMLMLNVALAVFNLLPIPPLDGSHVLESLLPAEAAAAYEQIQPYGFIILILLLLVGAFGYIIMPVFGVVDLLLQL